MGRNRGKRKLQRGRFAWKGNKANRGRRPGLGKRKHFINWPEVRAKALRNGTVIVVPPQEDGETGETA